MIRAGLLTLTLLAAVPPTAAADEATEAEHSYRRATALRKAGRFEDALDHYFLSNRLSPNPAAVLGVAYCFQQLGRVEEAVAAYEEYLADERSEVDLGPGATEDIRRAARAALDDLLPRVARLRVVTRPPGAEIFVDRVNLGRYGRTPRVISPRPITPTGGAPLRRHEVILTLPGYRPARRAVELEVGTERLLDVELAPVTGRLLVTTDPPGAEVRLAGTASVAGQRAPATFELPIGEHRVEVIHPRHARAEREVAVLADQTVALEVTLDALPPPTGRVRILSNVAAALVRAEGREVGFTPLVVEVPEGPRKISVEKPGHLPWEAIVTVSRDLPVAAEVTLEPLAREDDGKPWRWALFSSTAASVAISVALTAIAAERHSQFSTSPTLELRDETNAWNAAADVSWTVSLLGGVATATVFLAGSDAPAPRSTARLTSLEEPAP